MSIREPIRETTEYVDQAELEGLLELGLAVCDWCKGSGYEDNEAPWGGLCETCGGSGAIDPEAIRDQSS